MAQEQNSVGSGKVSDSTPRTSMKTPTTRGQGTACAAPTAAAARPDSARLYPPLDAHRRWLVCVHEAGHAVAHALGGAFVYRVAVAPLGDTGAWRTTGRRGTELSDLLGVCSASDSPALPLLMTWDAEQGTYVAHRDRMRQMVALMEPRAPGYGAELRRQLRAHLCALLAGPAAEALAAGEADPYLDEPTDWGNPAEDITVAWGHVWLLPYRREFEHAAALTLQTLREPAVWACVLRLAEALQAAGELEDQALAALLPPRRKAWPPPPPRGAAARAAQAQATGVSA